jgi:[CysO sulfur-carrier protein]-S-L-cysteine hydrolase
MNLRLAPEILETVTDHAKNLYPKEGCGLIAGAGVGSRFVPIRNSLSSSTQFEMDPAELIPALRDIRERGEELLAIYHSHPHGPARPSTSDIERAYYPEAAHLIVSLADPARPQAAAFRILDGEALEIDVHVIV